MEIQASERDGFLPFECDLCIFRKLRRTNPISNLSKDDLLLACIRHMNLDAFWSRTRLTVQYNTQLVRASIKLSELLGLKRPFEHSGPYLVGIAADMRYSATYFYTLVNRTNKLT